MYRSRKNHQGSNHRRSRSGPRKIKSFDPSSLVKQAVIAPSNIKKYIIQHKFTDFNLNHKLEQNILACGFQQPTPIQDQVIPLVMEGKDVVGRANTGTGKTGAFLIPLINNLLHDSSRKVLIMTPTRELAVQIEDEFRTFARGLRLYSTLCIGGTSINSQIKNLRRTPHFVIGTPGRLIDLSKRSKINFHEFAVIVLDEADRMLDMGFINDMKFVIQQLPSQRQTLFFSATLPETLDHIIHQFATNPVRVDIQSQKAGSNVDQAIVRVNGGSKVQMLQDLLKQQGFDKVLVFGRTKHGLNKLLAKLSQSGIRATAIHGNKSQNQRLRALEQFSNNRVQVLLATDVASRGLDIHDVTHVINYDLPESYEAYIHRIGRTGRAGKTGKALSFVE